MYTLVACATKQSRERFFTFKGNTEVNPGESNPKFRRALALAQPADADPKTEIRFGVYDVSHGKALLRHNLIGDVVVELSEVRKAIQQNTPLHLQLTHSLHKELKEHLKKINAEVILVPGKQELVEDPEKEVQHTVELSISCSDIDNSAEGCLGGVFATISEDDREKDKYTYMGHTEWNKSGKSPVFKKKVLFPHTVGELRKVRIGVYADKKKLNRETLIGDAVVSLNELLDWCTLHSDPFWIPMRNDRKPAPSTSQQGAKLGLKARMLSGQEQVRELVLRRSELTITVPVLL